MANQTPLEVATAFTKAWTSQDMEAAAGYIADDVVFDGPMQKSAGKEPYMEGLRKLASNVDGIRIISAFGDDHQALLMYDLLTGPYGTLSCAKNLTVRDGKIVHDKLTFDSHLIRAAKTH